MTHPLKQFRRDYQPRRLSQKQLADMLGVHRETVARWEAGRKVDLDFLDAVVKTTGIPAHVLRPDVAAKFQTVGAAA